MGVVSAVRQAERLLVVHVLITAALAIEDIVELVQTTCGGHKMTRFTCAKGALVSSGGFTHFIARSLLGGLTDWLNEF